MKIIMIKLATTEQTFGILVVTENPENGYVPEGSLNYFKVNTDNFPVEIPQEDFSNTGLSEVVAKIVEKARDTCATLNCELKRY